MTGPKSKPTALHRLMSQSSHQTVKKTPTETPTPKISPAANPKIPDANPKIPDANPKIPAIDALKIPATVPSKTLETTQQLDTPEKPTQSGPVVVTGNLEAAIKGQINSRKLLNTIEHPEGKKTAIKSATQDRNTATKTVKVQSGINKKQINVTKKELNKQAVSIAQAKAKLISDARKLKKAKQHVANEKKFSFFKDILGFGEKTIFGHYFGHMSPKNKNYDAIIQHLNETIPTMQKELDIKKTEYENNLKSFASGSKQMTAATRTQIKQIKEEYITRIQGIEEKFKNEKITPFINNLKTNNIIQKSSNNPKSKLNVSTTNPTSKPLDEPIPKPLGEPIPKPLGEPIQKTSVSTNNPKSKLNVSSNNPTPTITLKNNTQRASSEA